MDHVQRPFVSRTLSYGASHLKLARRDLDKPQILRSSKLAPSPGGSIPEDRFALLADLLEDLQDLSVERDFQAGQA